MLSSDEEDDNAASEDRVVFDKFVVVKSILNEYNKEKRISDDPLLWWKVNGNTKFQPPSINCSPIFVVSTRLGSQRTTF